VLREGVANAAKIGGGKAVLRKRARRRAENLREINDCVTGNSKGKFRLAFAGAFDTDEDEGAGIENAVSDAIQDDYRVANGSRRALDKRGDSP